MKRLVQRLVSVPDATDLTATISTTRLFFCEELVIRTSNGVPGLPIEHLQPATYTVSR